MRAETTMTWDWIAERLAMGTPGYTADCLRKNKAEKHANLRICGTDGTDPPFPETAVKKIMAYAPTVTFCTGLQSPLGAPLCPTSAYGIRASRQRSVKVSGSFESPLNPLTPRPAISNPRPRHGICRTAASTMTRAAGNAAWQRCGIPRAISAAPKSRNRCPPPG